MTDGVDNTTLNNNESEGDTYAAEDIDGIKFQRVKLSVGGKDVAVDVSKANPMPITGFPLTVYGEVKSAENTTIAQINATYGLLDLTLTVVDSAASGTTTVVNDSFTCQTGGSATGLASILTLSQSRTRPGQSTIHVIDAIFNEGVALSQQAVGLITSENSYVFAFLGTTFGIAHTHGGISEEQELTITTPAAGAETATINIDGNPFSVPLTAGTVQHNAFEISNSLQAQVSNYNFTSNDDQVVAQSVLAGPQGVFTFTSATAVAAWVQEHAGVAVILDFIPQTSWNIDKRDTETNPPTNRLLDPLKGNVYLIQVGSNFGSVNFFIMDSNTGSINLVHQIKSANKNTAPNVTNQTFRLGWLVQSLGATTNLTVSGNAAGAFLEGRIKRSTPPRTEANEQLAVGTTLTNIITFRPRIHFGGKVNRAVIIPTSVSFSTQSNKSAFFEIIANPTFGGDLDFSYVDKENSIMEFATDAVSVTAGRLLGGRTVVAGSAESVDFNESDLREFIALPGQVFSIASKVSSGAAADMQTIASWLEDLQ